MNNIMKKLLIIIPIFLIVLIAIIIAILYFSTDLLKSNEELFWKYISQAEDVSKIYINNNISEQENFKQTNSYTANGNIKFVLTQGENSFKQFDVSTNSRHDANTDRTYTDFILKNGELDLFKVSYSNSGDIYGIKCDDVFESYIGIKNSNLTELAKNYGIENIPDSIQINEYINLFDLSDDQKQHIQETYLPIIMKYIDSKQYIKESKNITVNETNYDVNVYSVEISSEVLQSIVIDCLHTLKNDTETLNILSEKLSMLGYNTEYTDTANITTKIDELIEKIQINDNLTISVYENNKNNIRTSLIYGSKVNITYDRLENYSNLSGDVTYQKNNEEINNSEIIDLTTIAESTNITSRFSINKITNENNVTNTIKIIPNIKQQEENIDITISAGNLQNNTVANAYSITLNRIENEKKSATTLTYDNNIVKADTVEEIEELSGSNTAIANNYTKEQFTAFTKTWTNMFLDKLSEKMTTLGLEEISNELKQISIE